MSLVRRTASICLAGAVLASLQLVTAQARASAMPPLDHDCQSSSAGTQSVPTTITLRITRGVGACSIIWNYGAGTTPGEVEVLLGGSAWNPGNSQTVSQDSPSIVTITNTAGTSTERVVFTYTRSVTPSVMWTYVLIGGGGGGGGASASVPNDIVIPQGRPVPASGLCADVVDAEYAYGTGLRGGWRRGWEPWVNPQLTGGARWGWACIRTLVNRGSGWSIEHR